MRHLTRHKYLLELLLSDGTLIILDSNKNANIELTFKEMFPVAVGSIELNTTEADITPPSFTVTFKYSDYSIKVL